MRSHIPMGQNAIALDLLDLLHKSKLTSSVPPYTKLRSIVVLRTDEEAGGEQSLALKGAKIDFCKKPPFSAILRIKTQR